MVAGVRPVLPAREGARMSSRPTFAAVLVFALMGCSEQEFTIPADRSILAWYGPGAEDRNHSLRRAGSTAPTSTRARRTPRARTSRSCSWRGRRRPGAMALGADRVRAARSEADARSARALARGQRGGRERFARRHAGRSSLRVRRGRDVTPDAAFASFPFNGPLLTPRAIHPKVEMRLFPRAALANADAEWSWTDLNTSASNQLGQSIDIRLALIQKLKESGVPNPESLPALQPENHP